MSQAHLHQTANYYRYSQVQWLNSTGIRFTAILVGALFSILTALPVWSATWGGRAGVSLQLDYVENSTNTSAVSNAVSSLSVQPFYTFTRVSRAQTLRGRVGVRYQRFSGDGGQSTVPSASLNSRITLAERGLWFNTSASATSRRVSITDFLDDALTSEEQTNTALQFQLGPDIRYQHSDNLRFSGRAGVARSQVIADGSSSGGSQDNTSLALQGSSQLAIDQHGNILALNSRVQETRFDNANEQARVASLSFGFVSPITPRFSAFASLGHGWIQIEQLMDSDLLSDESDLVQDRVTVSGEQYGLGIKWQPNRRVVINAEYAQQAFGDQPTVSMVLLGRRSQLKFQWSRNLQITQLVDTRIQVESADNINDGESLAFDEAEGNLLTPETCDVSQTAGCVVTPFIVDSQTIDESIAAVYSLRGRKSSMSLSLIRQERRSLNGSNRRKSDALTLSLSRTLARNLSAGLSGRMSRSQSVGNAEISDSQSIRASMTWLSR